MYGDDYPEGDNLPRQSVLSFALSSPEEEKCPEGNTDNVIPSAPETASRRWIASQIEPLKTADHSYDTPAICTPTARTRYRAKRPLHEQPHIDQHNSRDQSKDRQPSGDRLQSTTPCQISPEVPPVRTTMSIQIKAQASKIPMPSNSPRIWIEPTSRKRHKRIHTPPRVQPRAHVRPTTLQSSVDDSADGSTLIESGNQTSPGSPLKNEIRPDSSCSNIVEDSVPRPLYHITQLAPPTQPKIIVSVFACNSDGKFLLGRVKLDDTEHHHRWNLPSADLHYKETFEHAALRILDRQVGMHARPATAVMLHTTQTVPTDVLPNEGQHTITVFMGLWIKDPIDDLTALEHEKQLLMEWRWVSWNNMTIKSEPKPAGTRGKETKAEMTLSEFYDLNDPLKQLKWLHYTDDFHPVDELKSKIACPTLEKSKCQCCIIQ